MFTYNEAITVLDEKRGDKSTKKLGNNTYLIRHDDYIAVKLHNTEVVKFYADFVELNTGGWHTMTTKARINFYAPCQVAQKLGTWYIDGFLFYDGIKIDYSGNIISKKIEPKKHEEQARTMKKKIKNFVNEFVTEMKTNGLDLPSGGDCWFCCLRPVGNMTSSDINMNQDHLLSHMQERYYVPSLLINAMLETGYNQNALGYLLGYDKEKNKFGSEYMLEEAINRALYKYMVKRLIKQ
jgi:hypothetical protein